ncbi:MAG: 4Fe-4S binding protein [Thermoplasmatales archaeon]|nr:MAG: 4Fe-4S binding protein [Thermoplasmatales archaeon]
MAVEIDKEKCTACGTCEETCPVEAIKVDEKAKVDEENCIDCGTCVDECPEGAISQ